jgi:hypothetical protein
VKIVADGGYRGELMKKVLVGCLKLFLDKKLLMNLRFCLKGGLYKEHFLGLKFIED